ncbi:alanyl-tRNA synthetase [Nematocida major]|uniref:alanyl-tRNA synthetase n=1 Tax=Nematocida major TaxID=1912982 RepID=UPI002008CD53|nr:alanyl-tRNA synthetase [Nematocida major]KAH9385518.1 alanyl-tRNA synthetase [Nematocida major]
MWTAEALRNAFLRYFEKEGHVHWKSSSVSPEDPTLLFTNSGMVQFKKKFLDLAEENTQYGLLKRACNYQKCIRAGGKHNDLDDVGKDTYHHTFFEMLGNWSFGDYFKKEAIHFGWEFLTEVLKLDKERIYVSYFEGDPAQGLPADTEAQELWRKYLPDSRILGFGSKENFWEMGPVGPCGPCTEIHYDRVGGRDASAIVNQDDPDVLEIWNIVFMQYNREEKGLTVLPKKHIDTGMGMERVLSILQNERSNYNTDLFMPLFKTIERILGVPEYTARLDSKADIAYRVVADHCRTITIALMDNVMPSNDGRGYTIRKILRRALGFQYLHLKKAPGLLSALVKQVFEDMSKVYAPEQPLETILQVVGEEESQFTKTLTRGLGILTEMLETAAKSTKSLSGESAFILYDRYGFPIDLTMAVAEQEGVSVDIAGFKAAQAAAKALSQNTQKGAEGLHLTVHDLSLLDSHLEKAPTDDSYKYSTAAVAATPVAVKQAGSLVKVSDMFGLEIPEEFGLVLNRTPFYSEAGGQEGDAGSVVFLRSAEGAQSMAERVQSLKIHMGAGDSQAEGVFTVKDTKRYGRYVLHLGSLQGVLTHTAVAKIDAERRARLTHAHTATHLLNYALSRALSKNAGEEIKQCGSLVSEDALRFDFHWGKPLTKDEVQSIEAIMNGIVDRGERVHVEHMPYEAAVAIEGVRHMKGEEYPENVRVVKVEDSASKDGKPSHTSAELCGGAHVENTSEIGRVRIMSEASIARGIRRISALCGSKAALAEQQARDLLSEEVTASSMHRIRERLDASTLPLVETCRLRDLLDETQKQQIKERKKHFDGELARLKKRLSEEKSEGAPGVLFVCSGLEGTTAQQVNKLMGPFVQALEKEKAEGLVVCEAEGCTVLNGWMSDGVERVRSLLHAQPHAKIGGKSPRVMGSVPDSIDGVASLLEKELRPLQ